VAAGWGASGVEGWVGGGLCYRVSGWCVLVERLMDRTPTLPPSTTPCTPILKAPFAIHQTSA